jgi:pyruvate/2-oxoglutarate dehydrogenase complex dihydrolipoamide dehydrogenase (E3) component
MPIPEEYDFVVLGSGEAGKYLAWTFASKGQGTVVVERKYVAGIFEAVNSSAITGT